MVASAVPSAVGGFACLVTAGCRPTSSSRCTEMHATHLMHDVLDIERQIEDLHIRLRETKLALEKAVSTALGIEIPHADQDWQQFICDGHIVTLQAADFRPCITINRVPVIKG